MMAQLWHALLLKDDDAMMRMAYGQCKLRLLKSLSILGATLAGCKLP